MIIEYVKEKKTKNYFKKIGIQNTLARPAIKSALRGTSSSDVAAGFHFVEVRSYIVEGLQEVIGDTAGTHLA